MRWECPGIPAIPTSAIPTLQVLLVQPQVSHDVLFVTFGAVTFWPGAKKSGKSSNSQFFQCSTSFKHCSGRRKGNFQSLSLLSSQCCFQMPVSDSQQDINLQSLFSLTSDSIPRGISLNTHLPVANSPIFGNPPQLYLKLTQDSPNISLSLSPFLSVMGFAPSRNI